MAIIYSILATIRFELSRVMTVHRLSVAVVMALFPPVMIFILGQSGSLQLPEFQIAVLCGMVCLLSLLLWATSNVYSELEGKSWSFVTTRPYGRWSILFGKYLIAFGWSFLVSWIALSLCMLLDFSTSFSEDENISRGTIWFYLTMLLFLASMVYSAIFSFLGVIIQRRAMVFAVGYFLVVELFAAAVPAIIGKIAMSYHMLCLLLQWLGWIFPDPEGQQDFVDVWGYFPPWIHLSAIFGMTFLMLGLSAVVIRLREYITLEDAQV